MTVTITAKNSAQHSYAGNDLNALTTPKQVAGSYGLVDSFGKFIPNTGPVGVLNFNQQKLRKWRAAIARVTAKTGRGVLCILGDSRVTGFGAKGVANFLDTKASNRAAKIAAYLTAQGIPAHVDSFFCDGNVNSGNVTLPQYDPRVTMGAGWSNTGNYNVGQWTGCGKACMNSTTLNAMVFAPGSTSDKVDLYYLTRPGFGTFTVTVNGSVVSTINSSEAQSLKKATITVPKGVNTFTITPTVLGTGVFIYGMDCYDSTNPKISVWTIGNSGAGIPSMTYNSYPWEGTQPFKNSVFNVDMTVIDIGVNDANNQLAVATFKANMLTTITNVQTVSDVALCTFVPASLASWPRAALPLVQSYWDKITEAAIAKGIPLIDHGNRFVSYEISNPLGYFADTLHQSGLGMADQALVDAKVLTAV